VAGDRYAFTLISFGGRQYPLSARPIHKRSASL